MTFDDAAASRQVFPRPEPVPPAEAGDVDPMLHAGTVWAYLDAETGDAVLTLTDDARGVLRLRTDNDEHKAVLQAVLAAAMTGARTAADEDTRAWWRAVVYQGEAVLDEMHGIGHLPRVRREEWRMHVRVTMSADQEQAFCAEHGLEDGDATRERLAAVVADELGGLGTEYGWWNADAVRVT